MVRLEKRGDSFIMITGTASQRTVQKPDISVLIDAVSELKKTSPDINRIKEGLMYLDESARFDLRSEIRTVLQKAIEKKSMNIADI